MATCSQVDELKAQFEDQGYVILKQTLPAKVTSDVRGELEQFVERLAQKLQTDGLIQDTLDNEPFETRLYRLIEHHMDKAPTTLRTELHWPGMFGLFFNREVLDLAEALLGSEIRLYPNYSVRPKLPDHKATEVLWHQDAGYTAMGMHGADPAATITAAELRMVNVWSPLVPARVANGCMQFIPGTHKLGVVEHVDRPYYLEIVEQEIAPRLNDAVDIELDPGDVVLFSNLLFHRGQPNRTKTIRWSCDWRYQDATQSTLRTHNGHLARSNARPTEIISSPEAWVQAGFR